MKVIISKRARADLFAIGEWIERDNPERAGSFVQERDDACMELGDYPESYPLAPDFGGGIRKRTYGEYLILYSVSRAVRVASIQHAARLRRLLR